MKVLLVNGSPHPKGCVNRALTEIADQLQKNGVESRFFHIGNGPVRGCTGCGSCLKLGRCVFEDDPANRLLAAMQEADGVIIGSPVYYAGPNGALCALLDRVFYCSGKTLENKPAAAIVNCRRGGASAAFDRLNKYLTIGSMPLVTSQYWNSTHGFTPEDVEKDLEGLQTMRTLADNMAWMLKSIEAGGQTPPEREKRQRTHFIMDK